MDDIEIQQLDNVESTHFWYKARKSQLTKWFDELSGSELNVLDLGSATGGNTLHLSKMGHSVTSVEYSDIGVAIQKTKGLFPIQADARNLPFSNNSFEVVICLDVLEHIEEDDLVIQEIHRVLKSGGRFLISVPEDPKMWSSHDEAVNHVRRYTKNSLEQLIINSGLQVLHIWSTLYFLRPALKIIRRFSTGSNLAPLNSMLNQLLYIICLSEINLPKYRRNGVTLWADGCKKL